MADTIGKARRAPVARARIGGEQPLDAFGAGQAARPLARSAIGTAAVMGGFPGVAIGVDRAAPVQGSQPLATPIGNFFRGLVGLPSSEQARAASDASMARAAAKPKVEQPAPAQAVAAALDAGRTADQPFTPQERMLAYLDTVLQGPVSLRQAQAVSGMLPAPAKVPTIRDQELGRTAQLSRDVFADTIGRLQAQFQNKEITEKQLREATGKATDAYFRRNAGLVGLNPNNLVQSELLSGALEDEGF